MPQVTPVQPSQRHQLAPLLDRRSAADAIVAYYGLEHPEERVRLFAYSPDQGGPTGFVVVALTGMDLFRPYVVPFAGRAEVLQALLRGALTEGTPVILHLPYEQLGWVNPILDLEEARKYELLRMNPGAYEPVLNVLVGESKTPDGLPRYEIRTAQGEGAAAGLNWMGDRFAEIYLEADQAARQRGLTRSALSAIVGRLLGERLIPVYRVETHDVAARTEAFRLGFRPTGARSLTATAVLTSQEAYP